MTKLSPEIVLKSLKKYYPNAHCALNYENPFQLLIATILSAQCTDERVNIVTKDLFKTYKKPSDLAHEKIEKIRATYKKQFEQESVLRVDFRQSIEISF